MQFLPLRTSYKGDWKMNFFIFSCCFFMNLYVFFRTKSFSFTDNSRKIFLKNNFSDLRLMNLGIFIKFLYLGLTKKRLGIFKFEQAEL